MIQVIIGSGVIRMELIKKCPKCSWEYPVVYPRIYCRFCNTMLTTGICSRCLTFGELLAGSTICRECAKVLDKDKQTVTEYNREKMRRWRAKRRKEFEEWVKLVNKANKNLKLLTEAEWLEACNYFKGCALCGKEEISARSFFIAYKYGGRYAAWNIVPTCEQCNKNMHRQQNPFLSAKTYSAARKITEYLRPKLLAAIKGGEDNESQT